MSDSADLKLRIIDDVKQAMRSKEKKRLGVLRLVTAAIKQREVDERIELDDTQILGVLEKMLKQRRDSIAHYQKAGRDDLEQQEAYEVELIQTYMPQQLTDEEIDSLIEEAIQSTGVDSIKGMGKVMGTLKPKLAGRADMGNVSNKIKTRLSS